MPDSHDSQAAYLKVIAIDRLAPEGCGVEASVDCPRFGEATSAPMIFIAGWVAVSDGKKGKVSIRTPRLTSICAVFARPDIASRFGKEVSEQAGFFGQIWAYQIDHTGEVEIVVEIDDGPALLLARLIIQTSSFAHPELLRSSESAPLTLPCLLNINSVGRSGSSLLMARLLRHPKIGGYAVPPYELRFIQRAALQTRLSIACSWNHYFQRNSWYSNAFSAVDWLGEKPFEDELRNVLIRTELSRLRKVILDYHGILEKKSGHQISIICEKLFMDDDSGFISWFWPKFKAVILVRDLRDMLCSFIAFDQKRESLGYPVFSQGLNQNPASFFSRLSLRVSRLMDMRNDHPQSTMIVRYEDLVLNPQACMREILEFCEVDADSGAVNECLYESAEAEHFWHAHATSITPRLSIGRWQEDLPQDLQVYYEKYLKKTNLFFGYD
jgi:hypothetical protein